MKKALYALCIALVIISFCSCKNTENEIKDETIYTINNEIVTQAEAEYFTKKIKPEIISHYIAEYSVVYDESFWTTEYDGTTPQEALENAVKEQIALAKIQLILCREHGIYEDISYRGLYGLALQYNEAHKNNQSVGLTSIPMDSFYDYYLDNGIMELKNILGENELKPTEDEINNTINEIKKKYPNKTEDEQLSIANDIIVEKKYDDYISKLYSELDA